MSVLNLSSKINQAREKRHNFEEEVKRDLDKLNSHIEDIPMMSSKLSVLSADHENLIKQVQMLDMSIEEALKACEDVKKTQNEFGFDYVTRDELKNITDEITAYLEEYVEKSTPRGNEDIVTTLLNKIDELEKRLNALEHVEPTDEVPETEIPKIVFKRPAKKKTSV